MHHSVNPPAPVGRSAFLLGFAGLLPQVGVLLLFALARLGASAGSPGLSEIAPVIGVAYPCIIFSFLGGMWWGFAMRRTAGQGRLVALAVLPSLVTLALILMFVANSRLDWMLVLLGVAIVLTLPVDAALVRSGDAPTNWMRLRVPLSIGLGALTIALGVLIGNMYLSI